MFQDVLRELVDNTDGGAASLLMDSSGIALDTYSRPDVPFDITTVGVEFSVVLSSVKRAAEMLDAGVPKEVAITTDRMTAVLRVLTDTYFLALAILPGGDTGKGRFLMRTAAPKLVAEL